MNEQPIKEREYKKSDAINDARKITETSRQNISKWSQQFLDNGIVYLSIITVVLLVILYAYNSGYYKRYGIPARYYTLDLHEYVVVGFQIIGLSLYIVYYYSLWRTGVLLRSITFNPLRVLYGVIILLTIFSINKIQGVEFIVFSAVLPVGIEVLLLVSHRTRKDKDISKTSYQMKLEDYVGIFLQASILKKPIITLTIFFTLIAPFWGSLIAYYQKDYEIALIEGTTYVVLADYKDDVVVERCKIDDEKLVIYKNNYSIVSIKNVAISNQVFQEVEVEEMS